MNKDQLTQKHLEAINLKAVIQNKGAGDVYAAQSCAQISIDYAEELNNEYTFTINRLLKQKEEIESKLSEYAKALNEIASVNNWEIAEIAQNVLQSNKEDK